MANFKLPTLLLLISGLTPVAVADKSHLLEPNHEVMNLLSCDMECQNNGVCRFLTRDVKELQKKMQAGQMIQECICPMGYHGMACEVDEQKDPCSKDESTQECECAAADETSKFSGEQCRRPFTQYCASLKESVGGHISYCTNGGKCMGDLIAAERSPWNTKNNYLFQHAGCICPPEFEGEHCEQLNKYYKPSLFHDSLEHEKNQSQDKNDKKAKAVYLLFSVGCFGVLGLMMVRRLRRQRFDASLRNQLPPPSTNMVLYDQDVAGNYHYGDNYEGEDSDGSQEGDRRLLVKHAD